MKSALEHLRRLSRSSKKQMLDFVEDDGREPSVKLRGPSVKLARVEQRTETEFADDFL